MPIVLNRYGAQQDVLALAARIDPSLGANTHVRLLSLVPGASPAVTWNPIFESTFPGYAAQPPFPILGPTQQGDNWYVSIGPLTFTKDPLAGGIHFVRGYAVTETVSGTVNIIWVERFQSDAILQFGVANKVRITPRYLVGSRYPST